MKKIILIGASILVIAPSFAQKKNVKEATKNLSEAEKSILIQQFDAAIPTLAAAKAAIDAACQDESTSGNWDTWFYKAAIYSKMQEVPALQKDKPFKISDEALQKALSLDKSKVENKGNDFSGILSNNAFYYYNDGIMTMQNQDYKTASKYFESTYELLNYNNGKLFGDNKQIDTIKNRAMMYSGYSDYYAEDNNSAITKLKAATKNPITAEEPNVFIVLSNAYKKAGNKTEQLNTIQEAVKLFPNDGNVKATEINYYVDNNEAEKMISKLESEVAANPNRDDYYYNLAFAYKSLADKNVGTKDEAMYWDKASEAFKKAMDLKPNNPDYTYNAAVSYFNRGTLINDEMNKLGYSSSELKKYDELKVTRDELFGKSLPYFEATRKIYQGKSGNLSKAEKGQFSQTLTALSKIYAINNNPEKVKETKAELDKL